MAKAINTDNLSPVQQKVVEMRREYQRKWRKENPEKVRAIAERYWKKKAVEAIENEKQSRPSASTLEAAKGLKKLCNAFRPFLLYHILGRFSSGKEFILNISDLLPVGESHALSMRELSNRLGASERETRAIILAERRRGVPICSDCKRGGGYYLPDNSAEALHYVRQQETRIRTAQAALNGVKKYLQEHEEG